jgi:hypothetical protein
MYSNITKWIGLSIGIMSVSAFNSAMATEAHSPCNKAAHKMFQACRHDVQDNLKTVRANCTNLGHRDERRTCLREAKITSLEESQFCIQQLEARMDACEVLGEVRYDPDPLLDPGISFVDPDDVDPTTANPYISIVEGHTFVLRTGEEQEEIVVVHATDEVRDIQGVPCRIVVDVVLEQAVDEEDGSIEYIPVEVTDDWFAQDVSGNVYYCGELARNFEGGLMTDLDGSFEAGRDYAKGGLQIMAFPETGLAHRQEFALGEAEDIIQYVDLAAYPEEENERYSCAQSGGCLMTYDFSPLAPEATEFKYYIAGVGFVLAQAMKDGEFTGERETLECVGDNLDVLEGPECGILDHEELMETLCKASPEAFCD